LSFRVSAGAKATANEESAFQHRAPSSARFVLKGRLSRGPDPKVDERYQRYNIQLHDRFRPDPVHKTTASFMKRVGSTRISQTKPLVV
jgi:hypothetical protein